MLCTSPPKYLSRLLIQSWSLHSLTTLCNRICRDPMILPSWTAAGLFPVVWRLSTSFSYGMGWYRGCGGKATKIGSAAQKSWLEISSIQLFFLEMSQRGNRQNEFQELLLKVCVIAVVEQRKKNMLQLWPDFACSTVDRLSLANETMPLPPKKEEKRVCFNHVAAFSLFLWQKIVTLFVYSCFFSVDESGTSQV